MSSRMRKPRATANALTDGHEQIRIFRRILRRLAEPGAALKPVSASQAEHGVRAQGVAVGGFGVFVAKNRHARPVISLDCETGRALIAAGLVIQVAPGAEQWKIAPEGVNFLRRAAQDDDPFQAQHRQMGHRRIAEGKNLGAVHAVNVAESPLAWLATRKGPDGAPLISPALYEAGERLREDYSRAQLMPRLTVDWRRPITDGGAGAGLTLTEAAIAARQRVRAALCAIGPELENMLIAVCCHLQGLEAAERELRLPPRSGKVVLKIALEALARHYGIIRPRTRSEMRSWQA